MQSHQVLQNLKMPCHQTIILVLGITGLLVSSASAISDPLVETSLQATEELIGKETLKQILDNLEFMDAQPEEISKGFENLDDANTCIRAAIYTYLPRLVQMNRIFQQVQFFTSIQ